MSVKKRGKRWYFDFKVAGARFREVIPGARTKWQAEQAETKARDEVFEGRIGIRQLGKQLLSQFVADTYVPWAKANKRTWRNDEIIANQWAEKFKGKILREISPLAIEKVKRERAESITRRGTTRSPASVNLELAVLSRIFALAVELEVAATNPCRKVRKLRVDNQRNRYLSADEETRLFMQLTGRRKHLAPLVALAIGTGMRRGELLSLRWPDVDFQRGVIHVRVTKTNHDRQVPMSHQVRQLLLEHRKGHTGELVFTSRRKALKAKGLGLVDVKKGFAAALADAGIADFHFHDLRHTFATRVGDAGHNSRTIARLLGHASTAMTDRYTHATDSALRSAVECAGESWAQGGTQTAEKPPKRVAVNG
jgi:integrase